MYRSTKIFKTLGKSIYEIESQKIYVDMALIPTNGESPRRDYGDRLKLTNWFLDSGETFHMTPELCYFILVSLA